MLQCGHGDFAVGNADCPRFTLANALASMRPRRLRRGELALQTVQSWFHDCFNASTATSPWGTVAGRGFLTVGPDASMRPRRLRRGERLGFRLHRRVLDRFNAATATSPWGTRRAKTSSPRVTSFNAATATSPWGTMA